MSRPLIAADVDDLVRRLIGPGDHVHLAGTPSRPNALTYALCRVLGAEGHLTVSTTAVHSSAHALALSGVADKVIAGFAGDTYPSPRPNPLYAGLTRGEPFTFEAWSLLSYLQRLMAGAQGAPYAVTGSLDGTDLAEGKPGVLHRMPDPADPERRITLLAPLRPDVTLVHAVAADEDGNIAMVPPLGEGAWAAYAAKRGVIASVERIVGREELRAIADRVVIPGQRVLGLCEAPLGAHPQSLRTGGLAGIPGYLDDYAFLEEIVESCHGPERGTDWYRDWVAGPGSHAGYLERLGRARTAALAEPLAAPREDWAAETELLQEITRAEQHTVARARPAGTPPAARTAGVRTPGPPPPATAPATAQERLIVLGARAVADQVRLHGYDTLLAGIGTSHMAAWLAAERLRSGGHEVKVVAELGAYGFTPQPGDVYLFSLLHAARSEMLAGIPEILGGMVAANPRALGVLAAAEIDRTGTINTSVGADGRWLTGSGGANDIASSTDCVVIAPSSRRRYVETVGYRTSPGDRVREVVSDFGRFRRATGDEPFRLATWLAPDEKPAGDRTRTEELAAAAVAARTRWASDVAGVVDEKPVADEELAVLRALDPAGRYR
ncbi:CoA-transferase [Streptomyces sp. SL13]|uniref:CoA-transferase n=1 Tax=Streptantibioticus silvisoli TaxID=2705255 RepID=A0AA90KEX4_9ACTN|nr:CoA-transferase [Streptantibioticus silvisoli]MDI5963314.1 CoA-transferase [Streptantibioticus silvisoli]MDI5968505.1 CoA-transferase [Streptantibioticus silvisoli]